MDNIDIDGIKYEKDTNWANVKIMTEYYLNLAILKLKEYSKIRKILNLSDNKLTKKFLEIDLPQGIKHYQNILEVANSMMMKKKYIVTINETYFK